MQKYYKIITERSYFRKIFTTDESLAVPYGTKVIASPYFIEDYEQKGLKNGRFYIQSDIPMLHFCDNAFDTMLWHSVLTHQNDNIQPVIYKIKPLTNVVKQRCADDIKLYQCGANIIEFMSPVLTDDMYELALAEFYENHQAKIDMYPNLQMSKIIAAWVHHKQSKYVY